MDSGIVFFFTKAVEQTSISWKSAKW